jgi:putative two-component system response regulator
VFKTGQLKTEQPSQVRADTLREETFRHQEAASMASVLIVDDIAGNARFVESLLAPDGHAVRTAAGGAEALRLVRADPPDLLLMEVMMPHVDGFETCRAIKQDPATRLIPVLLVTSLDDSASRIRGIEAGADDFASKPFNAPELRARIRSLLRIKRYTDELDSTESVLVSLALTIEARDSTTDGHCKRLAQYASALGRTLGLDDDDVSALARGGFLHDIGKIGIPDAVLLKKGPLTPDEYELIKHHAVIGDRLCGDLRSLRRVRPIVRHHHERLDGSGYPDGLLGDATPLTAQIMGIVDVFDALTTERPYKVALPFSVAAEELGREVACGWRRADLVATFLDQIGVAH